MVQTTTEMNPLVHAIKRLGIPKDAKRVLLALADAGDWTPMPALETLLGKTGLRRVVGSVTFLLDEELIEGAAPDGNANDGLHLRARAVEQWTKDEHFTTGAGIRWGY